MKFGTREDIEAPIEFVFEQMTDFKAIERAAMRRGAEVQRVDKLNHKGVGMMWDAAFELRGKAREIELELTEYDPPNGLVMASRSAGLGGKMKAELVALSRTRTRVTMDVELEPKNLTAKLLVQSLKLAKKSLMNRLNERMAAYSKEIERRYKQTA
ncbi:MAG: SRPBCC family protein [Roseovarius sp.]|uniref:SRPBCC family protein n=1 Tax=Roseovarius sp. TaxID=1486281 RepID=UPI0032EC5C7E